MDARGIELKTFVSQSIKKIIDGVIEAQEYATPKGGTVNVNKGNPITEVKFDVAVVSSSEKIKGGGAGAKIFVASVGVEGKVTKEYSTSSRLSFVISIELPKSKDLRAPARIY